jgi:hypothetical protein
MSSPVTVRQATSKRNAPACPEFPPIVLVRSGVTRIAETVVRILLKRAAPADHRRGELLNGAMPALA